MPDPNKSEWDGVSHETRVETIGGTLPHLPICTCPQQFRSFYLKSEAEQVLDLHLRGAGLHGRIALAHKLGKEYAEEELGINADAQPSEAPLSGEFADTPTVRTVLTAVGAHTDGDEDEDEADAIIAAWEEAYFSAWPKASESESSNKPKPAVQSHMSGYSDMAGREYTHEELEEIFNTQCLDVINPEVNLAPSGDPSGPKRLYLYSRVIKAIDPIQYSLWLQDWIDTQVNLDKMREC